MLKLVRRACELVILSMAMYAFVSVPLGSKTGLEHARAILGTPEAKHAGEELQQAGLRVVSELLAFGTPPYRGEPQLPELPSGPRPGREHPESPSSKLPR